MLKRLSNSDFKGVHTCLLFIITMANANVVRVITPIEQCLSLNQNRRIQNLTADWVGFDKCKKFIYGVIICEEKLQLIAQSVFGGNVILVQQFSLDDINPF